MTNIRYSNSIPLSLTSCSCEIFTSFSSVQKFWIFKNPLLNLKSWKKLNARRVRSALFAHLSSVFSSSITTSLFIIGMNGFRFAWYLSLTLLPWLSQQLKFKWAFCPPRTKRWLNLLYWRELPTDLKFYFSAHKFCGTKWPSSGKVLLHVFWSYHPQSIALLHWF